MGNFQKTIFTICFFIVWNVQSKAQTPGGISLVPSFWVKANTTTPGKLTLAGTKASAWSDEKSAFSVTQGTAANQPVFVPATANPTFYNYNPRLSFSQSAQTMLTNAATTPDLVGATGVMFLVTSQTNLGSTGLCYKNSGGVAYQFKPGFRIQSGKLTTLSNAGWTIDNLSSPNCPATAATVLVCNNNSASMTVRRNGVLFSAFNNANSSTYYPQVANGLGIGGNTNGGEWTQEEIGEVILYNAQLTVPQMEQVESYLCVKYGITKGTNGSATAAYVNTSGTSIWPANTGYHNDIAGIGKEMITEQLDQPKSKSVNFNEIVTIANQNFTSPQSLTNNGQYVIWGNNGQTASTLKTVTYTQNAITFSQQLQRVWRIQQTGAPSGNMVLEIGMSNVSSGTVANNSVALLTDNDAVFGNGSAGEGLYYPEAGYATSGGNLYFIVPYSSLPATGYFTLAVSMQLLPVELLYFNAAIASEYVALAWATASETNSNYFGIERSTDGVTWQTIEKVSAAHNTTQRHNYSAVDDDSAAGQNYYRLKMADWDGVIQYSSVREVVFSPDKTTLNLVPNPVQTYLKISFDADELKGVTALSVYNVLGVCVYKQSAFTNTEILIATDGWVDGTYMLIAKTQSTFIRQKIVISH